MKEDDSSPDKSEDEDIAIDDESLRKEKSVTVNDIGYWKGVRGHHVFVNSELGLYMDHMKGKRKKIGTSAKNDLKANPNAPADIFAVDYWKKVPPSLK